MKFPKIKIKTTFWTKTLEQQRDKLVNILFVCSLFYLMNSVYFMFTDNGWMFIFNILMFTFIMLINISYNKREK